MTTSQAFADGQRWLAEGRYERALESFSEAADGDGPGDERGAAMAHAAEINLRLDRPHEALVWTERLREEVGIAQQADLLAAQAELRLENGKAALALLAAVTDPNTSHHSYEPSFIAGLRSQAMALSGDAANAREITVRTLREQSDDAASWRLLGELVSEQEGEGADLTSLVAELPETSLTAAAAGLVEAPTSGAEKILGALWERWPDDARLHAVMAAIGHRLSLTSALEWSAKMRAVGQGDHCPLLGIAASTDRHPRVRARAAAVAGRTFGDPRARGLLELATTDVADEELVEAFDEVVSLAPDFADSFVLAAARTGKRALVMARLLDEAGNVEPAVALARHALELSTGQPSVWAEAVRTAFEDVAPFATRAESLGADDVATALRTGSR